MSDTLEMTQEHDKYVFINTFDYYDLDNNLKRRAIKFQTPNLIQKMEVLLFSCGMKNAQYDLSTIFEYAMDNLVLGNLTFAGEERKLKDTYPQKLNRTISLRMNDEKYKKLQLNFHSLKKSIEIVGLLGAKDVKSNKRGIELSKKYIYRDSNGNQIDDSFFYDVNYSDLVTRTYSFLIPLVNFNGFMYAISNVLQFAIKVANDDYNA